MVPLPNGRNLWLINGGDPNHLRYLGAHPPSEGSAGETYGSLESDLCQLVKYWKSSTTNVNFAIPKNWGRDFFHPFQIPRFLALSTISFWSILDEKSPTSFTRSTVDCLDRMGKFTFSMTKKKRFWDGNSDVSFFQRKFQKKKKNVIFCKQVGRFYVAVSTGVSNKHLLEHSFFFRIQETTTTSSLLMLYLLEDFCKFFPGSHPFAKRVYRQQCRFLVAYGVFSTSFRR